MAVAQIDQFTEALFGKVESVLIVCHRFRWDTIVLAHAES
jgi:hypothetical protein